MEFTAEQIADLLGGKVDGDPAAAVDRLAKIEEGEPRALSFLANPQYTQYIYQTQASVVIVGEDFQPEQPLSLTLVRVAEPYAAFAKILAAYEQMKPQRSGVDPRAYVAEGVELGDEVYLAPGVCVEEGARIGKGSKIYHNSVIGRQVVIGENCVIHSGVQIYDHCILGNEVQLHSGVVVGSDGFGFAPRGSEYDKVAQIGNVVIEDQVEIGANTTIDRATLGSTRIGKGVKLDNLIQIAHNVEIGAHSVIASQTGVAGSTKIGKNCMIAGQVGIIGHLKIGDGVKIAAQSGITHDLADGAIVQGSPAFAVGDYRKSYIYFRKLPELARDIHQLKKQAPDSSHS